MKLDTVEYIIAGPTPAGALVERDIPMAYGATCRVMGIKVEAPGIAAATTGRHGVGLGWTPAGAWLEGFALENDTTAAIGYTAGFAGHPDNAALFAGGGLAALVGTPEVPLRAYYTLGGDAEQPGNVTIRLVVGYES